MSATFGVNEATLTLVKQDGRRVTTVGTLHASEIIVEEDVPVEVGDQFEHLRPSGVLARFRVASVYHSSILSHYQCKVKSVPTNDVGPRSSSVRVGDIVVTDATNVVVQVGQNLSTGHHAPRLDTIPELAEVREHLLTLLDQDISTKKILWEFGDVQTQIRLDVDRLLEALAVVVRGTRVTEANARTLVALAADEAARSGAFSKGLFQWASSHPISQNMIASAIFEVLKGLA